MAKVWSGFIYFINIAQNKNKITSMLIAFDGVDVFDPKMVSNNLFCVVATGSSAHMPYDTK